MSLDEQLRNEGMKEVVETAKGVLQGKIGIIEGSRILSRLRFKICEGGFDPDFYGFIGIDSATDHLPIGRVREHWAEDALVRKDKEIKEAEDSYREKAFADCRKLIQRFGGTVGEA
jgi:hypothetical protein